MSSNPLAELPEASSLEALDRDFQQVLQELRGDKGMESFMLEYEKMYRALRKSHDSERRLLKKCRELGSEIIGHQVKVEAAAKLGAEDAKTIDGLKQEIEKAWRVVEESHDKEVQGRAQLQGLHSEAQALQAKVEDMAQTRARSQQLLEVLNHEKEALAEDIAQLASDNQGTSERISQLTGDVVDLEREALHQEGELSDLRARLVTGRSEAESESMRRDKVAKELQELRAVLEQKRAEEGARSKDLENVSEQCQRVEQLVREERRIGEKVQLAESRLASEAKQLRKSNEEDNQAKIALQDRLAEVHASSKAVGDSCRVVGHDHDKLLKEHEAARRRKVIEDQQRAEVKGQRSALKAQLEALLSDLDTLRRRAEEDAVQLDDLLFERNALNDRLLQFKKKGDDQFTQAKSLQDYVGGKRCEVDQAKAELQGMLKRVYELDRQRTRAGVEMSNARGKQLKVEEELRATDTKVTEAVRGLEDLTGKVKAQKALYEQVRGERNMLSKSLTESQGEVAEMKLKFKAMYHDVEQLKGEIVEKEHTLTRGSFEHQRVAKVCSKARDQLDRARKRQAQLQQDSKGLNKQIQKLEGAVTEAEQDRLRSKKTYETAISERDILGTQLIRRNDELALLYEKVHLCNLVSCHFFFQSKIQQRALENGSLHFSDRVEEAGALQVKIASVEREIRVCRFIGPMFILFQACGSSSKSVGELKRAIYHLQRELVQEKTRVKALSEELEDPNNTQRWRWLGGADPTSMALIQKVKALQLRLISRMEQCLDLELLVQEKDKTCSDLRHAYDHRPSLLALTKYSSLQHELGKVTKRMRAVAAELNMSHLQVTELKDNIDRTEKEAEGVKSHYYDQKKRHQLQNMPIAKDQSRALTDVSV